MLYDARDFTVIFFCSVFRNIIDNPGNEQYRQLRIANKTFNQRVWRHTDAQAFMALMGWVQVMLTRSHSYQ